MDCDEDNNGPITRLQAKAMKLAKNNANQNIEKSQQNIYAATHETEGISVNQNDKRSKRKTHQQSLAKLKNKQLACKPFSLKLLNILDNLVCRNHVLSFLQVGDLLRLRRVCKSTKAMSQDFIRFQKVSTNQPLKISFRNESPYQEFNQFQNVSNPLPIRNYLHVTFNYRMPVLKAPAECTNNITHLTIVNLKLPFGDTLTLDFLESFPKVTHLVLDQIQVASGNSTYSTTTIPQMFKNLKSLTLLKGIYSSSSSTMHLYMIQIAFMNIQKIVEICIPNLEYLSIPFSRFDAYDSVRLACLCLFSQTNLKLEDVTGCLVRKLLSTEFRRPEMRGRDEMIRNINAKVVSIERPNWMVLHQELPNLEKINFETTELSCVNVGCVLPFPHHSLLENDWPKLKEIRVHFKDSDYEDPLGGVPLPYFWEFLFAGIVREHVVELHISFSGFNGKNDPTKRTRDILASCPNLKRIYFKTLSTQLVDLPKLWRGLPYLEKLCFDKCVILMDKNFIGADTENPAFLELKNLKVLEFLNMDVMYVTDTLFNKVLRHMPLKELYLCCNKHGKSVVKSITLEGIKSLLSGKFAKTVEKLSIENLRIRGVTREEIKRLESRFRSSQMY